MRPVKIAIVLLIALKTYGQSPVARFDRDSAEVGARIKLSLSYLHESRSDIVFPDSTFDFTPFELVSTDYFETRTQGAQSLDSVVYTLVFYELEDTLTVRPFVRDLRTGKKLYAEPDTVFLKPLVSSENLLTQKPKDSLSFTMMAREFNLPKVVFIVLGILTGAFLLFALFNKWVKRSWILAKLGRRHRRFVREFKKYARNARNKDNIRRALTRWKTYIEEIDGRPISTMSSSEIRDQYTDERLFEALKLFDSAIYGNVVFEQIPFAFNILLDFANRRFRRMRLQTKRQLGG